MTSRKGLSLARSLRLRREKSQDRTRAANCLCSLRKSLRYAALWMGWTLTAMPVSTQPSNLRETVSGWKT